MQNFGDSEKTYFKIYRSILNQMLIIFLKARYLRTEHFYQLAELL